jgi:hypothetical protein
MRGRWAGTTADQAQTAPVALRPVTMIAGDATAQPTGKTTIPAVLAKAALFGVAGWAAENALYGPRYSAMWQGRKIPFLPIYAAGGVAVLALAPKLANVPMIGRAAAYTALLGGLEYAGCQADRKIFNGRSWDYEESTAQLTKELTAGTLEHTLETKNAKLSKATDGCVDLKHAALWGLLGLLAENVAS